MTFLPQKISQITWGGGGGGGGAIALPRSIGGCCLSLRHKTHF